MVLSFIPSFNVHGLLFKNTKFNSVISTVSSSFKKKIQVLLHCRRIYGYFQNDRMENTEKLCCHYEPEVSAKRLLRDLAMQFSDDPVNPVASVGVLLGRVTLPTDSHPSTAQIRCRIFTSSYFLFSCLLAPTLLGHFRISHL